MLFGHQDDVNQPATPAVTVPDVPQSSAPAVNPLAVDPATGASLPAVPAGSPDPADMADEPSVLDQPSSAPAPDSGPGLDTAAGLTPDPGTPFSPTPAPTAPAEAAMGSQEAEAVAASLDSPAADQSPVFAQAAAIDTAPDSQAASIFGSSDASGDTAATDTNGLLDLKQQAISQLSPLVSHLDQSPEDKFRTTMMLIQSTDNPALLQDAYGAAQAISDEKARAQALLDVVNEINYFTQQQGQSA